MHAIVEIFPVTGGLVAVRDSLGVGVALLQAIGCAIEVVVFTFLNRVGGRGAVFDLGGVVRAAGSAPVGEDLDCERVVFINDHWIGLIQGTGVFAAGEFGAGGRSLAIQSHSVGAVAGAEGAQRGVPHVIGTTAREGDTA